MPDVVIIGGGVIGLLSAFGLRRRGVDVILVERDRPGRQASWASAGILSAPHPLDLGPIARLKQRSMEIYPDLVADLRETSGVDSEMSMNGQVIPAFDDADLRDLREQARLEPTSEMMECVALHEAEPALGPAVIGGLLRVGGQIDPRRLCRAAEVACRRLGVEIVHGAAVTEVLHTGGRVSGVQTLEGPVYAPIVVNAAGSWSRQIPGCDPVIPVVPQRGEILALDQTDVGLKRVITKFHDPYLVPRVDGRLIVGATRKYVGYNSAFTGGGVHWLLSEALEMVPAFADAPIVEIWTGFRPNSMDSVPAIGPGLVDGLFFATGHGPSGINPGPASAELLVDLITGATPKVLAEPYDPRRFKGIEMPDPRTWGIRGGMQI